MMCSHHNAVAMETMYVGKEMYCSGCENQIRCVGVGAYEVIE